MGARVLWLAASVGEAEVALRVLGVVRPEDHVVQRHEQRVVVVEIPEKRRGRDATATRQRRGRDEAETRQRRGRDGAEVEAEAEAE